VFVIVPVLLMLSFWMVLNAVAPDFNVLELSDNTVLVEDDHQMRNVIPAMFAKPQPYAWTQAESMMFNLQVMIWYDRAGMIVKLFCFTFMVLLSFRYFLVFFPQMAYITMMIKRVTKPVMVALFVLLLALASFAACFFLIFSDQQYEFRNWLVTVMAVLQFAHGGFLHWKDLYQDYAWTWFFLMTGSFVVFTMNLNNILIAILVSHKKEAELHSNYSSHPFWQSLHRDHMQSGSKKGINPALAGFDFGQPAYKDGPKRVTEELGWQI